MLVQCVALVAKLHRPRRAVAAAIAGSSGFDALDKAVLQFYETIEFLPGEADGKAIETTVRVPVNFKLTN